MDGDGSELQDWWPVCLVTYIITQPPFLPQEHLFLQIYSCEPPKQANMHAEMHYQKFYILEQRGTGE